MCGIVGIWKTSPGSSSLDTLTDMTHQLSHRGPDADGYWSDEKAGIYFGHRRLSIIDLSEDGAQPMTSASGRYTLIYNGEIYNFQSLRKNLTTEKNISFRGHSDTEVLLNMLETYGVKNTLDMVRGMFAFALWDGEEQALYLTRDHFGKKPLYVGWAGTDLLFASELKSFMNHPDFQKRVKNGSQSLFMTYGYIPAPNTVFENIWQLLPGHYLKLTSNDLQDRNDLPALFQQFWSAEAQAKKVYQDNVHPEEPEALKQFEQLLTESVLRRMVSDVPLGSFLSGGIDSSLITAIMQAQSIEKIRTFSIGFNETDFDEAPFAKQIATHLGTEHHELYVDAATALNVVEKLPFIYDEPFADISALPTYLLSEFAKQDVTVALSGDGGDELLGGYTRHIKGPQYFQKMQGLPVPIRNILESLLQASPAPIKNKYFEALPFLKQTKIKDVLTDLLSLSPDRQKWTLRNGSYEPYMLENLTKDGMDDTDMMILGDVIHTLPNKFLVKVDRASMANSLEVRSPFLDLELYNFAWSLPLSMKVRHGKGKWLSHQLLEKYVPSELFSRPKQGFNIPLSNWLNNELRDWIEDLLNEPELTQNGFDADQILKAWKDHKSGLTIYADKLWAVCQYQQWARHWL